MVIVLPNLRSLKHEKECETKVTEDQELNKTNHIKKIHSFHRVMAKIISSKPLDQDSFSSMTGDFKQVSLRNVLANLHKQPLITNCEA